MDLPVSVLDKNGKLIPDIPQSAFKVYENNVEQPIKSFRARGCSGVHRHHYRQQRQHAG